MPVVSSSIPSLINGVSQQPDALRLPSQCTLSENTFASVVKGVRKRPPSRHMALLSASSFAGAYLHTINRSTTERYAVVITNGDLKVWSLLDGTPRTVNFPNGKAYLNAASPQSSFVALTVADFTFIANKNVTCAMSGTLTPTYLKEGLVYVRQGAYGCNYNVYVNGSLVATYLTSTTAATDIDTTNIASHLASAASTALGAGWTVGSSGSLVYIIKASGDFTLATTDGLNNQGLVAVKDTIQRFSSLPSMAPNGFKVKVIGDSSGEFQGYYVQFVDPNGTSNAGTWQESTAQAVSVGLDQTTMPWELVRNGDGTFTFQPVTWVNRLVGDDTSAPPPSLVGRQVSDIFFHRNRLGFTAGENVVLSKAGSFFDLFPDTVTQVLDSDPIDIAVNHVKVSTIRSVAPYQQDLLLFSDQTQFVLSGGDLLSPKTVTIKPVTEFENDSFSVKPIYTGKVVYFAVPRGSYEGVRELQTLPVSQTIDAPEVTAHVPQYIKSGCFKIAASANVQMLALLTNSDPSSIYTYQYFWNGEQKMQSAWMRWVFDAGDTILNIDFIQTALYALIQRSDGLYLEVFNLELGNQDSGFTFQVNLDRLCFVTGSYNATTNLTTWTTPYQMTGGTFQVVLGPSFSSPAQVGTVLNTTQASSTTLTAVGNFTAGACYIGRQYTKRHRLSHIVLHEPNRSGQGGIQAVQEGRLQLNRLSVSYEQTGYFRAEVTPYARQMYSYPFTAQYTGLTTNTVGGRPILDGLFRFPVLTDASNVQIDLVNDTYLPSSFQTIEWEGKYYSRSNRV